MLGKMGRLTNQVRLIGHLQNFTNFNRIFLEHKKSVIVLYNAFTFYMFIYLFLLDAMLS